MKQKNPVFIGIDLGGSKILMEAFDSNMKLVMRQQEKTESENQNQVLSQMYRLIDKVFHRGLRAIGVAVPGPVDFKKGVVVKTPHLPFRKNLPLKFLLQKRYKVPVTIENDINAFLFAEHQRPALKKIKHLVALMIGTGVGGAIIANGQIVRGKKGYAGEVGHMIINPSGPLRSLEQNVSGSFIPQISKSLGIKTKINPYDLGGKTPEVGKVKQILIQNLGLGLANLNLIFNPEAFVLGGSIYYLFLSDHKKELRRIIAQHALDGKSPTLIDGTKKASVARGVVLLAQKEAEKKV